MERTASPHECAASPPPPPTVSVVSNAMQRFWGHPHTEQPGAYARRLAIVQAALLPIAYPRMRDDSQDRQ